MAKAAGARGADLASAAKDAEVVVLAVPAGSIVAAEGAPARERRLSRIRGCPILVG